MAEQPTGFETIDIPITLGTGAEVTRHLLMEPRKFKLPAVDYPGESFEGIFPTLDFDKTTDESAYCEIIVPHRWKSGSDVEVVVDWLFDAADNGAVVWGVEYLSIGSGDIVAGGTTTITKTSAGSHTEAVLVRTTFALKILGSALGYEKKLGIRFYRDANNAADTLGQDARLLAVHFHFTMDKFGKAI